MSNKALDQVLSKSLGDLAFSTAKMLEQQSRILIEMSMYGSATKTLGTTKDLKELLESFRKQCADYTQIALAAEEAAKAKFEEITGPRS